MAKKKRIYVSTERSRERGRESSRLFFLRHRERALENMRQAYKKRKARDPEGVNAKNRKQYRDLPPDTKRRYLDRQRNSRLVREYGLTSEAFDQMLEAQQGVCALCHNSGKMRVKQALVVDHDHDTGKVRSLLCDNCNKGLGFFNDDPEMLWEALYYLISHGAKERR